MKKILEKKYKMVVFIMLAFVFVVSVLNASNDSAIYDETAHIPAAYSYLKFHELRLNPEHPPLIKDLAAFPLMFLKLNFDTTQDFWTESPDGQWDAGGSFLYGSKNNPDRIVFWSRIPIVILSIIFGLFIFFWARQLAGKLAGLFALALYAFDPNILGHNHFVTTDLGIAAFMAFAFYFFLKFVKDPSWKNVFLAGIFVGLLQLAKFSSIVIFPIFAFAAIVYPLVKINKDKAISNWKFKLQELGKYVGKGAIIFALSLVVVWFVYFLNFFHTPQEKYLQITNYVFNSSDYPLQNSVLTALGKNKFTQPLGEYALGMLMVFKRVAGGNGVYYMGQVTSKAFLSYFPVVFLIKEPLASLFFMVFALLLGLTNLGRKAVQASRLGIKNAWEKLTHFLRTKIVYTSMFLFIALYSYISITGNLNIGFRHLFPILPFIYILTAKIVLDFAKNVNNKKGDMIVNLSLVVLIVFLVSSAVFSYPSYTSYFNELAGGSKNGYHFVTDSNADWGQDLKRLKVFLGEHPEIGRIRVDYFGGGNPAYYLGRKYTEWHDYSRPIESGWYAISTNFLQGSVYDKAKTDKDSYAWLNNLTPAYQIGTSILVYEVNKNNL